MDPDFRVGSSATSQQHSRTIASLWLAHTNPMPSSTKKAAFATRSERALVLRIVHEDFGDVAERVAETLLRSEGMRLAEITHKLQRQSMASSVYEV